VKYDKTLGIRVRECAKVAIRDRAMLVAAMAVIFGWTVNELNHGHASVQSCTIIVTVNARPTR
jgi:hypothetical protein